MFEAIQIICDTLRQRWATLFGSRATLETNSVYAGQYKYRYKMKKLSTGDLRYMRGLCSAKDRRILNREGTESSKHREQKVNREYQNLE